MTCIQQSLTKIQIRFKIGSPKFLWIDEFCDLLFQRFSSNVAMLKGKPKINTISFIKNIESEDYDNSLTDERNC